MELGLFSDQRKAHRLGIYSCLATISGQGGKRKRSLTFRASSPVLLLAFSMSVSTFACFYASASSHATGQPKREEGQGTRPQTRLASKKHKGPNSQSNQRPRKTARANQNPRIRRHPPASTCSADLLCSGLCSEHNQDPFSELHLTRARRTAPLSLGSPGVSDIEIEPLAEGGAWRDTP